MARETRDAVSDFFSDEEHRGVATVAEVAQLVDLDEQAVRTHARANDLRRAGTQFLYSEDDVHDLVEALEDEDSDEDDEDDEDNDEDADEGA